MVYRRIEPTPAEQLKALCKTRDHYVALADQLHDNTDPELNPEIKLAEERNARRIAHAYEKSVANSMVRMSSMQQTHKFTLPSLRTRTWLMFFMAMSAIEGALLLAYFRPAIFQIGAPRPAVHGPATQVTQRPDNIAAPPPGVQLPSLSLQAPPPIVIVPKPIAPKSIAPRPRAQLPSAQPQAPPPIALQPRPNAQFSAPTPVAAPPPPVTVVLQSSTAPPIAPPAAPVAAVPQPSTQPAPAAPIASFVAPSAPATPPPQAAASVQPPVRLEPVLPTHSLPPYPAIARSLGEEGTTQMRVAISVQGTVTDCEIVKSSGSVHLDSTACGYVQEHWRWKPPTRGGQPVTASIIVSMVWNLRSTR